MPRPSPVVLAAIVAALGIALPQPASSQAARISEEVRTLRTYPFDEPDPIPILARDPRLYPYHAFRGYATDAVDRPWTVVRLENEWIEVFVLPEVGGKVWGAVVKDTGHEFIYRNEVMKFRNIALRGPWTSGGIEFNFGVIGHTPATATPVDYRLVENPDGSVSCWVGGMDLPSRTHWRVEIRLPADRAAFETRVSWSNPTPLEQPYYNWMTAAAFARDDLEMTIPGDAFLEHSGRRRDWPMDGEGRYLPLYRNNTFDGHKSYHVVGEVDDFFGGYYHDDDWGFGHWARYEDMPGQKLWLWALSREGGVWEDLLTDTDGQYVEFQAGRLFVQYSPGDAVNPITQAGFDPGSTSRWSETWFPVEGIGGLTDASDSGALHVERDGTALEVGFHAFVSVADTLEVWSGTERVAALAVELKPLQPFRTTVTVDPEAPLRVRVGGLDLDWHSDPSARRLARPFETDPGAFPSLPQADQDVFQARELMKGREYGRARPLVERALAAEPWNREALLASAELAYRRGAYADGLESVNRVLQLDAYHARANFLAGTLYRALGRWADARDAFGWAARSTAFRSAAYVQLAEIMVESRSWDEAMRYARLALDYDRSSLAAWLVLATAARLGGASTQAADAVAALRALDPLEHLALAEEHLAGLSPASAASLLAGLGGEYPDQTLLEMAVGYAAMGLGQDAVTLLSAPGAPMNPVHRAWKARLLDDPDLLAEPGSPAFVFPYRVESIPVLRWAAENDDHWTWRYLLALNLWARDRADEALALMEGLGDTPDFAPAWAARGLLREQVRGADPVADLTRAVTLDPESRLLHVALAQELEERGRWDEALDALTGARGRFPDDFNLALLEVQALLQSDRAAEATRILANVRVLPSENARESHRMWAQAHTLVALEALEAGDASAARRSLERALEWPESLGQGRPYDPEERLERFLLGIALRRLGEDAAARDHFRHVVASTEEARDRGTTSPRDLLAGPAARMLGAADRGGTAAVPMAIPDDLDGRILSRALALGDAR